MARLPGWIHTLARSCFTPIIAESIGERPREDRRASKFGGLPWLVGGERWPRCGRCTEPLTFFVQLDLDTLPDARAAERGPGLLQLFYCTGNCDSEGGWEPFSPMHSVRILVPTGEPARPDDTPTTMFPLRPIVGWNEDDDAPSVMELAERGIDFTDEQELALSDADVPRQGDKLGGWPAWVQGVEYPACRTCGERMRVLFQVDSEDNVPFMFGDSGCGHITQCSTHLEVVAFGWACC